jgi:hypothetical protein
MRVLRALSLTLLFTAMGAVPVLAQQASGERNVSPTMSASALDAALTAHSSAADRARLQLAEVLSSSEVQSVAADRGIDMNRVEAAAAGLSDAQVQAVAPLVTALLPQSSGGMGTVTISVVALILILLVLILVT